ncbi:MAG: symmetrical bis(5'-nucleosyl)-tetraphosphatase [Persicimonas sp.]
MAHYAIGDVHGCFQTLERLLARIEFDPKRDQIWLTGDLVNGGPDSLATVRWAVEHRDCVDIVLGNHDLHMLAVAEGAHDVRPTDTFGDLLEAPDADELLDWLRRQPLVRRKERYLLVHAALLPSWSPDDALRYCGELQRTLADDAERSAFFEVMYGNEPPTWDESLGGHDRLRAIVNATVRLRTLDQNGRMTFDFTGPLEECPEERTPWFEMPNARWRTQTILFGHWSALGLHKDSGVVCLDSGCRWGGKLTAMRLDDEAFFQVTSEMPKEI